MELKINSFGKLMYEITFEDVKETFFHENLLSMCLKNMHVEYNYYE